MLYLINMQILLSEKIRQELRHILGYINIFLFPVLLIINVYFFIQMIQRLKYEQNTPIFNYVYITFSCLLYARIIYIMLTMN